MKQRKGISYKKRVYEINRLYDTYARSGLSNREIWRRYVYPHYGISERTFYNMLAASAKPELRLEPYQQLTLNFDVCEQPYVSPFQSYP